MIGNTFYFAWEVRLIEWCQANIPLPVIFFMEKVSLVGDVIPIVIILCFVYLCYDKKIGKIIAYNVVTSLVFSAMIKNIFNRRRPYFDNENIKCLKPVDDNYDVMDIVNQGFSFPSMHSSNAVIMFGTLYKCYKKKLLLYIAILSSFVVGISRFILGCHYPSDVMFGWLLGIFVASFLTKLQGRVNENKLYIITGLLLSIGFIFCKSSDYYMTYGIYWGIYFAVLFDDKYIHFKQTKNIVKSIFRLVLAGGAFLLVTEGLKLPFSYEFLEASCFTSYLYRFFRYMAGAFAAFGLTPCLYKFNILKLSDEKRK